MVGSGRKHQKVPILQRVDDYIHLCENVLKKLPPWKTSGRLTRIVGLTMEAVGLKVPVGSSCLVIMPEGLTVEAEVVGFAGEKLYLMPSTSVDGLEPGAKVVPMTAADLRVPRFDENFKVEQHDTEEQSPQTRGRMMPAGFNLLGRVLDGTGRVLDKGGPIIPEALVPLYSRPFNPMDRAPIHHILDTGVRAINSLLTVGRGQRMGLFAGSGVGKSVLLGMMARFTSAEIVVVGLIGERGREVKEFIENILGADGLARSVVVAAPADTSPLQRLHGAAYATALAEYFRDQGKNVLLIMDSLTRYAMAQREIALAIGEPPATKGYPPSVFAKLPALVERAGNGLEGGGSITAFYTVLSEGDDQQDPIADSARAILDGHVVLSRSLADQGHYPAIDVEMSVSRAINELILPAEMDFVRKFKNLYSRYQRNRDLINVGAYVRGNDPVLDKAIAIFPKIEEFLQQSPKSRAPYEESRMWLQNLMR